MTELVSLKGMPRELKIELLRRLGYGSDDIFVLEPQTGKRHHDKYTGDPVRLDNMVILPGSAIVLDNNPLSISSFLEEFGDVI